MRVLQLPSWYLPEGGQFCLEQSLALKEEGIEVHLLANVMLPWCTYKWKIFQLPFRPFFTIENDLPTLRNYFWRIPKLNELNNKRWINKTVKLFDKYLKKYGEPDIIHVHSSIWAGVAAERIKEKYGIPYIITEHRGRFSENSQASATQLPDRYTPLLNKAFSNADSIITVSDQLQKKIKSYLQKEVAIQTISNILDTDFFHIKENLRMGESFVFVTSNSFDKAKAYDILLPAFDIVSKKHSNAKLHILGNGFNNTAFQTIVFNCKSKNNILFFGHLPRERVREQLVNANAYVLASRTEAQPVSVLEAMSCGLPVVCTKAVPAELAIKSVAIQCETNNIDALAKAMIEMIENHSAYIAEEIRAHAVSICGKEIVSEKIIAVYKQLIK